MKFLECQTQQANKPGVSGESGRQGKLKCTRCGHPVRPAAKFCEECGHRLDKSLPASPIDYSRPKSYTPKFLAEKILTSRASIEGERKVVTVLFADVADYTSLAEKLDPEDVHQIMDGCFRILMDEIHRFEGTINQFTGDGIMALFGAPIAHEDHARLACYAALSIRKSIAEYGAQIHLQRGFHFQMRLGLNSGPVFVGSIGDDLRMDYTAIGDTANLAARIQGLAQPGAVYTSASTHRMAGKFFRFKNLGRIQVKGKEDLQELYDLTEVGDLRTRIEAAQAEGLTKFVGREREMRTLREAVRKARSGAGRVLEIFGEPGAGKTRLLLELKKMFGREEALFLEGRCLPYGNAIAYLPILEVVRSYFEIQEGDEEVRIKGKLEEKIAQLNGDPADLRSPLEDLLGFRSDDEAYGALEPKEKRERIFRALGTLFHKVSRERVLVLIFEDVHWIDKTSEDFLGFLAPRVAGNSLLLFLVYRPEYRPPWGPGNGTRKIGLEQLSPADSAELVHSVLGTVLVAPEIQDLIAGKASGNPLFTEELTRALRENGIIRQNGEEFILLPRPAGIQIPETIEGIIASRMDRLEEDLKRILQAASVIGREFPFGILHSILEKKPELATHLSQLKKLDFIYEKQLFPEMEYVFKHALTQEVAYKSLLLRKRRQMHAKIGKALEEFYEGRLEEGYETLAYHYSRSEDLEKAYSYLRSSGEKAVKNHSNWEALRFFREAIGVLRQTPPDERNKREQIEVLLAMAVPMRLLGNPDDFLPYVQDGERLCRELGDRKRAAKLYTFLGLYHSTKGDPILGRKYQEESFQEAGNIEDLDIMAPIGYALSFSYLVEGEFRKVMKIAPRVTSLLERTGRTVEFFGSPGNLYSTLQGHYGLAMGALGNFSAGEQACQKALSFARGIRHVFSMAAAEFHYGILFTFKEDGPEIIRHMERAIRYFEKSQSVYSLPSAWSILGYGYFLRGDLDQALRYMEKGLRMQTDFGIPIFLSLHHLFLSWVLFETGDLPQAKMHVEASLEVSKTHNEKYVEGMSWVQLGRILGRMEGPESRASETHMRTGMTLLRALGIRPWISLGHMFLADRYAGVGQRKKALGHVTTSVRMFREMKGCADNYNRKRKGPLFTRERSEKIISGRKDE